MTTEALVPAAAEPAVVTGRGKGDRPAAGDRRGGAGGGGGRWGSFSGGARREGSGSATSGRSTWRVAHET